MSLRLEFVGEDELSEVADMADGIWHEYFPFILSEKQIDYMVDLYQSERAMVQQVAEKGYRYAFIVTDEGRVGYTGISSSGNRMFISKLYLKKEYRGRGYGTAAMHEIFRIGRDEGLGSVYLTVNKRNERAIRSYTSNGFKTIQSIVTDIGDGFVMDDYVMEKVL
ncbi:MAG: GNAT family N-acetyltransferase [Candidatus Methanomethylophilaceae archaeon]